MRLNSRHTTQIPFGYIILKLHKIVAASFQRKLNHISKLILSSRQIFFDTIRGLDKIGTLFLVFMRNFLSGNSCEQFFVKELL